MVLLVRIRPRESRRHESQKADQLARLTRDTPGLHDIPECGKLMWFNILRAQALRVTALAVHSDLAGPRVAEHTKLQLESFLSCARARGAGPD